MLGLDKRRLIGGLQNYNLDSNSFNFTIAGSNDGRIGDEVLVPLKGEITEQRYVRKHLVGNNALHFS